MEEKLEKLKEFLKKLEKVAIAFSGGLDSSFLLKVAKDVLSENVVAITLVSPLFPKEEIKEAKNFAKLINVRHILIEDYTILEKDSFTKNTPERCYICKKYNFQKIIEIAKENNIKYVLDGSNADDLNDYRPGRKALKELNILSPLLEFGFTKKEIRELSKKLLLPTYNKPSLACLATRIPYGEKIDLEKLKRIEEGEKVIRKLGFCQVRLRDHGDIARIEIDPENFPLILEEKIKQEIINTLKNLGYKFITIDLEGYKTGSMNKTIKEK